MCHNVRPSFISLVKTCQMGVCVCVCEVPDVPLQNAEVAWSECRPKGGEGWDEGSAFGWLPLASRPWWQAGADEDEQVHSCQKFHDAVGN